ncbi:MAG: hypothetical protein ACLGGX_03495 [Bdellovibrionia bacterium]
MKLCPVCSAEQKIESQHHGTLFTCSSCNAVFFVNWDGDPEVANHDIHDEMGITEEPSTINYQAEPQVETNAFVNENPSFEESHFQNSYVAEAAPASENNFAGTSDMAAFESPDSTYAESGDSDSMQLESAAEEADQSSFSSSYTQEAFDSEEPKSPLTMASLTEEIESYANSDQVLDGLKYDLEILDIDSSETRELLFEIFLDPRLAMDAKEQLEKIENGKLRLRGLNVAKTFVIVEKCEHSQLNVVWRQNV